VGRQDVPRALVEADAVGGLFQVALDRAIETTRR
jgi:hypothetical protein